MEDLFFVVRVINFAWSFLLFMVLVYYGVMDLLLTRKCAHTHIPPEMQLWAAASVSTCAAIFMSLTEIFIQEVMGGYRVFFIWPFFVFSSLAAYQGRSRIIHHRRSVELGHCS